MDFLTSGSFHRKVPSTIASSSTVNLRGSSLKFNTCLVKHKDKVADASDRNRNIGAAIEILDPHASRNSI